MPNAHILVRGYTRCAINKAGISRKFRWYRTVKTYTTHLVQVSRTLLLVQYNIDGQLQKCTTVLDKLACTLYADSIAQLGVGV